MRRYDQIPKWQQLLGDEARQRQNEFEKYPENFRLDHQDQAIIHKDCQSLESISPIFKETELKNTLELILTYYCKTEKISYKSGLHQILAPFLIMRLNNLKTVYGCFSAFIEKMMPLIFKSEKIFEYSYQVFQKLMMYHEPLIFNTLQSSYPEHSSQVKKWLQTCLASCLETTDLLKLWEHCLYEKDYLLPIFAAISILYRQREKLLKKKQSKGSLKLESVEIEDFQELISSAAEYQKNTPEFFLETASSILIQKSASKSDLKNLEKYSVVNIGKKELARLGKNYILIDIRPFKVFSKAHLDQAFNISMDLPITTGKDLFRIEDLWSIITGFTTFYSSKHNKTCHYVFICSEQEIKSTNSLCFDLIRRGIDKVSIFSGEIEVPHGEKCVRCKLSREIQAITKDYVDKVQILKAIWDSHLAGTENKDRRSEASSSRSSLVFKVENNDLSGVSMHECLRLMWTSNLIEAEAWFEARKEEDPRCSLHFAEAGFLKALLLGDNLSKENVFERLGQTEKIAVGHVKKWKSEGVRVFSSEKVTRAEATEIIKASQQLRLGLAVKAESILFKSGTEVLQRKLTTGISNFRKSWNLYQKVKKNTEAKKEFESKHFPNARSSEGIEQDISNLVNFGEGIISLGLLMATRGMNKVARATIGIETDQNKGIGKLYECINSKMGIRVPLSLMFLAFWLLIYIPDYVPGKRERLREAHELIKFSLHYYSQSPFFYWLESYLSQKQGNLERALKLLNKVIMRSQSLNSKVSPGRLNFERGWVLFLCQEWSSAAKSLEETNNSDNATPFTKLVLGISYCMAGNLDEGQSILEELENISVSTAERWICRRASRYLQRRRFQIFPFELIYVTDSFTQLKNEWFEACLDYLDHIFFEDESPEEVEEKAIWLLLRGTIYRLIGRLQQSVAALNEAIRLEGRVRDEVWVIPHLYYELSMNYAKSRDWNSSNKYLRIAKGFKKKYEFSQTLIPKMNSALDIAMQEENKEYNK